MSGESNDRPVCADSEVTLAKIAPGGPSCAICTDPEPFVTVTPKSVLAFNARLPYPGTPRVCGTPIVAPEELRIVTVIVTGSVVVLAISMNPLYDEAASTKNHGPVSAVSTILNRKLKVADGTGAGPTAESALYVRKSVPVAASRWSASRHAHGAHGTNRCFLQDGCTVSKNYRNQRLSNLSWVGKGHSKGAPEESP